MQRGTVNERILDGVRQQSGRDDAVGRFLIELIYLEAEHPHRWKQIYKKVLEKATQKWSEANEN